jgi:hypothetical protein
VAFSDIFFFEDTCKFCYGFDSFVLILSLLKVGIFLFNFNELKTKL